MTPRSVDDDVLFAINWVARHTGSLHQPFLTFAKYGVLLFAALLLAGIFISRHRSSSTLAAAGWACLATLLAVALNQPLGHLVAESRPYDTHPHILRLAAVTSDFSFPSDHAVMGGAVAAGLLLVDRRLGIAAAVLAFVMAFARVYIAAHYPWDVLGGLAFGAAVSLVGWWLLGPALTATTTWLRRRPGLRNPFSLEDSQAPSGEPAVSV